MSDNQENVKIKYDLDDNASPKLGKMSESFATSVAKGLALYEGLKYLGQGIGSLIESAEESRRVLALTNSIISATGGAAGVTSRQVVDLAQSLSKVTNYDDEVIQGGENLLLTFNKIGKEIFPQATQAMLDMSAAMGNDVKTSAIQLGKALNDPTQGINALRKSGVSFSESQIELIKSLQASGNLLEAQKIILQALSGENGFGGAAKAAANFRTIFKNMTSNVLEDLGGILIPAIEGLLKNFAILGSSINAIGGGNALNKLFGNIGILLLNIGQVLGTVIESFGVFVLSATSGFRELAIRAEGYINIIKSIPKGYESVKEANKAMQIELLKNDADYNSKYLKIAENRVQRAKQYDQSYAEIRAGINGEIATSDSTKTSKLLQNVQTVSDASKKSAKQQQDDAKESEKAQEEAFEAIMESHADAVTQMQLNNQYTHDAEINLLNDLLNHHIFTEEQRLSITRKINEQKKQSNDDLANKIKNNAIATMETEKEQGDISYFYFLQRNAEKLENEQITEDARRLIHEKSSNDLKRIQNALAASFISSITDVANQELSIKEKVVRGSANFIKKAILNEVDMQAKAAASIIIGQGLKMALPTFGGSIAIAAGQLALLGAAVAAAHTAIDSIKLAEGGIVLPKPGGTNAVIGEAGRAEAVIPLGSPRAKKLLGSGGSESSSPTRVIILDADGKTTLARGLYRETQKLIRTGQLAESRL